MKRLNTFFYLCSIALCSLTLTSCGGDDDANDSHGGGGGYTSKRILSVLTDDNGAQFNNYFTYDKQGRVVSVKKNSIDGTSTNTTIRTYTYTDTKIIREIIGEVYGNIKSFYLSDGRIVREESIDGSRSIVYVYTYDNNGFILTRTSYTDNIKSGIRNYKWENGNLIEESISGRKVVYTYTNIPWLKGMFSCYEEDYWDPVLRGMGYYGNLPKCLPATISRDNGTPYIAETYKHSLSGENVGKLEVYKKERTITYTFTWQ